MQQITLLRHGKPEIETNKKISAAEYGEWVNEYNRASIDHKVLPARNVIEIARQSNFIVCSDLARSVDSATALGIASINIIDPLFREFDMPCLHWKFPKRSASFWSIFFRLLWIVGFSSNSESFGEAKQRATECLQRLTDYAAEHDTVLFVGHGSLLWYLSKLLRENGWHGPKFSPRKHWDYCVYTC